MDETSVIVFLEDMLYCGEIEVTKNGNNISLDFDNEDVTINYDFNKKVLRYSDGTNSGEINLGEIADKISEKYKPKNFDDLKNNWDNILSEYFGD